jgi:hypothetical protein
MILLKNKAPEKSDAISICQQQQLLLPQESFEHKSQIIIMAPIIIHMPLSPKIELEQQPEFCLHISHIFFTPNDIIDSHIHCCLSIRNHYCLGTIKE